MTTPELLDYIKLQNSRGVTNDQIRSTLAASGWKDAEIEEGFSIALPKVQESVVNVTTAPTQSVSAQSSDVYREPIGADPLPEFMPKLAKKPSASVSDSPSTTFTPRTSALSQSPSTIVQPVLSSYPKDMESFSKISSQMVMPKRRSYALPITILVMLVLLGGGGAYFYMKGFFKPSFTVPFLEQDPNVLVSNVPESFTSMKSLKADINIDITFPSVNSLVDSLLGGVAYVPSGSSNPTDTFSISGNGEFDIANNALSMNLNFANSHLGDEGLATNIVKKDGLTYIYVPDMTRFFGEYTPASAFVSMDSAGYESVFGLLGSSYSENKNIQSIKNLLVHGLPGKQVGKSLYEVVKSGTIASSVDEVLGGINTKHFHINLQKDNFVMGLQSIAQSLFGDSTDSTALVRRDNFIKDINIESVDLWIGKDDNLLYKYEFMASLPMSRVVGQIDQNIDPQTVNFKVSVLMHDFGTALAISAPENSFQGEVYATSVKMAMDDKKLKNNLESFSLLSRTFYQDNGKSFGKKSNSGGSCVTPIAGSLYSPLSQKASVADDISSMQSVLTSIISITSGKALCYSNSNSWAIYVPTVRDISKAYCVDNKGSVSMVSKLIKGPSCE